MNTFFRRLVLLFVLNKLILFMFPFLGLLLLFFSLSQNNGFRFMLFAIILMQCFPGYSVVQLLELCNIGIPIF